MQIAEEKILENQAKLTIQSNSANVALARVAAAAFASQADLTLGEIDEIKVAVSEAVSNSVIHAYGAENAHSRIEITMNRYRNLLEFIVTDYGKGIADVEAARQPSFSTDEERMGLGFVFMESFMDLLEVKSELKKGTVVIMSKKINTPKEH